MVYALRAGLLAASLLSCMPVQAAWLQVCPSAIEGAAGPEAQILQPDGTTLQALVSDQPGGHRCEQMKLDVSARDILALRPITRLLAADLGIFFSLSGKAHGERFLISEITPGNPTGLEMPASLPLPLNHNLLASLRVTGFGAENRVDVSVKNGQLLVQCQPGQRPAGVVLGSTSYLPRARSLLQIRGSGKGDFKIMTSSAAQAASGSGSPVGFFQAEPQGNLQGYELEKPSTRADWRHWTLACPAESARLQLDSLQLVPQHRALPPRSAWVWQAGDWQSRPNAVFALAKKYGLGTVFITVPLTASSVGDPELLTAFVKRAKSAGLSVWAVDGDPNMVRLNERVATLERARAYARFNNAAPPGARLQGVQFDVEPYLLPGHELAAEDWDQRYKELVKALRASFSESKAELALEMVVPFWWADKQTLLDTIAPWVDSLTVMDYRTDPKDIYRFAVPFLDWGDRHGKAVRIALEAGFIAPETRYRYEKAAIGELWQIQLGRQDFLVLLKQPQINPHGAAFRLSNTFEISASATTFHGDSARLLRQLPILETMFSAWPGFAGMALHEIR